MSDDDSVFLFHITMEKNLPGIIEEQALIPGGNENGIATLLEEEESNSYRWVDWAKDKIFVSANWNGMVPWIEKLNAKKEWPVILRISIPIGELPDFELFYDLGDNDPPISWYFVESIPIGLINIAVHDDPDSALSTSKKPWSFKPLGEYNLEEIPDQRSLPDLLELPITNEFEMSEAAEEARNAFFDGAKRGHDDE